MFINSKHVSFKSSLRCLVFLLLPLFAKANLGITPITTQVGNEVTVDFLVYNFTDILSMQYTVHWDPAVMTFESLEDFGLPALSASNYGIANAQQLANGQLTHSWHDPQTIGLTLPDCSTIYRLKFTSLNGQASPISITGAPTPIEVVTSDFMLLDIELGLNCNTVSQIHGNVYLDGNGNCAKDDGEVSVQDCAVQLEMSGLTYTLPVGDDGGYYFLGQGGNHTLSLMLPNQSGLTACTGQQTIELEENEQVELDFGVTSNGLSDAGETAEDTPIRLYPNPARTGQTLTLTGATMIRAANTASLFNPTGAQVQSWRLAGTNRIELPTNLPSGLYCLQLVSSSGEPLQAVKLVVE